MTISAASAASISGSNATPHRTAAAELTISTTERRQRRHPEPHEQRRRHGLGGRDLAPVRRDREVDEDERQPGVADDVGDHPEDRSDGEGHTRAYLTPRHNGETCSPRASGG